MDYVKIGGRTWNVLVLEVTENFNILCIFHSNLNFVKKFVYFTY